jgi:NAD(P)-dependent dehydrogenase (short-subunit alcohol dehydrogenase family)
MNLTDKVVLITGARRLGAEVAKAVAARGADVALTYNRSRDESEAAAGEIRAMGRRAVAIAADVSDPAACDALIQRIASELGRLDVVVNMASLYHAVTFDALTPEEFDRQLSVDLRGTFLVSRAAVPLMRRAGGGRIVNFSDWIAASGRPRYREYFAYYVAKAGVKALTEILALELAEDQILVNAIAPGPVLAPPETTDEESDAVIRATPLGRWGGAEPIVSAVLALIENDFITGETIRVDGGRHLK